MTLSAGIPFITAAQMREADKIASVELGISVHMLMENASAAVAKMARDMLAGNSAGKSVVVLAGKGNNGGDGLGAARHLLNFGCAVKCILTSDPEKLKPAVRDQYKILNQLRKDSLVQYSDMTNVIVQETLASADLVIDALLGLDLKGDPRRPVSSLIDVANDSGRPILAVDVPSGLDANTGQPFAPCIKADVTLTLAMPKSGLMVRSSRDYVGKLFLADISLPFKIFENMGIDLDRTMFSDSSIIKIET